MMVGESGQLVHAPFALGADAFYLQPADASAIIKQARAVHGPCAIAETVPTAKDPASGFWFSVP